VIDEVFLDTTSSSNYVDPRSRSAWGFPVEDVDNLLETPTELASFQLRRDLRIVSRSYIEYFEGAEDTKETSFTVDFYKDFLNTYSWVATELDSALTMTAHITTDLGKWTSPGLDEVYSCIILGAPQKFQLFQINNSGALSDELRSQLDGYAALKPDWDGYGAKVVSKNAITMAKKFLSEIPLKLGKPSLAPVNDGSVSLVWERDKVYIDVEFDRQGCFSFYAEAPGLGEHELYPIALVEPTTHPSLQMYFDVLEDTPNQMPDL
jgi:hypothetical protein